MKKRFPKKTILCFLFMILALGSVNAFGDDFVKDEKSEKIETVVGEIENPQEHKHQFTYLSKGSTIIKTCSTCDEISQLSIVKNDSVFSLQGTFDFEDTSSYEIIFKKGEKVLDEEPILPAVYTANVTVKNVTATLEFEIPKEKNSTIPKKPVVVEVANNSIKLENFGYEYEYSLDGANWQHSNVFNFLDANTEYTFYTRIKENEKFLASEISEKIIQKTDKINIEGAKVSDFEELVYNGQAQTPKATVSLDDGTIVDGTWTEVVNVSDKSVFTPLEHSNFKGSIETNVSMKKKVLTWGEGMAFDKVYDGKINAEIKVSPKILGVIDGDEVSITKGNVEFVNKNVGIQKIIAKDFSVKANENYQIPVVQPVFTDSKISKAQIIVTVNENQSKQYGAKDPEFKYNFNGATQGEAASFSGKLSREEGESVGEYKITAGDLRLVSSEFFDCQNYDLKVVNNPTFKIINTYNPTVFATSDINENDWQNKEKIKLFAPSGFTICLNNAVNSSWQPSVDIGTVQTADISSKSYAKYYLRNNQTGEISIQKSFAYKSDKSGATNLNITYDRDIVQVIMDTLFFGWFGNSSDLTVSLCAEDYLSGIQEFTYYYDGNEIVIRDLEIQNGVAKAQFKISPEYSDKIYFSVKDNSGNVSYSPLYNKVVLDTVNPKIDITGVGNNNVLNGEVIPVIKCTDENFDSDSLKITLKGINQGEIEIKGSYLDCDNGKVFVFDDFPKDRIYDDIYTLSVYAKDFANNEETKEIKFTVNRFGSSYVFDTATKEIINQYVSDVPALVIKETNVCEIKEQGIVISRNNEKIELVKNKDYSVKKTGGNGNLYEYEYEISAEAFSYGGQYQLDFSSVDKAGNTSLNSNINFGVDKIPPTVEIENMSDGEVFNVKKLLVSISAIDDLKLENLSIYLDDYSKEFKVWDSDKIENILNAGGKFQININGDKTTVHNLKVVAEDIVGNKSISEIKDFYVTTDVLVGYYNNEVMFFGTIAIVFLIATLFVIYIFLKKRS